MYGQSMTQSTCPLGNGGANPHGAARLPKGYDFTDPDVLLKGIPVTEFAELRTTAPVPPATSPRVSLT